MNELKHKKHRFRSSEQLDLIAESDGSTVIGGGGVSAHRLAELNGSLSVILDSKEHLFDIVYGTPTGEVFTSRFDHFPTPTELLEFVTTRVLHIRHTDL